MSESDKNIETSSIEVDTNLPIITVSPPGPTATDDPLGGHNSDTNVTVEDISDMPFQARYPGRLASTEAWTLNKQLIRQKLV